MIFVKNSRGGREVNMINTFSKINLSKIGWEGGGLTSIWIMSLNILSVFLTAPLSWSSSWWQKKEQTWKKLPDKHGKSLIQSSTFIFAWFFKEWKLYYGIETWKHLVKVELFACTWKKISYELEKKYCTSKNLVKQGVAELGQTQV